MENNLLVKKLASNNQETREQAFESLRTYLTTKNFQNAKQSQFDKLALEGVILLNVVLR